MISKKVLVLMGQGKITIIAFLAHTKQRYTKQKYCGDFESVMSSNERFFRFCSVRCDGHMSHRIGQALNDSCIGICTGAGDNVSARPHLHGASGMIHSESH